MRFSFVVALSVSLLLLAGTQVPAQTTQKSAARRQTAAATPRQTTAPAAAQPPAAYAMPRGNAEHGRYLAEHVAMCVECHSGRDHEGNIIDFLFRNRAFQNSPPPPH